MQLHNTLSRMWNFIIKCELTFFPTKSSAQIMLLSNDWQKMLRIYPSPGIFSTQRSNPGLPHCRWILHQLSHKGSPRILEWVVYLFSSRSSQPRNWTRVSCIAGGFFTNWAIRESLLKEKNWKIIYIIILYMSSGLSPSQHTIENVKFHH